MAKIVEEVVVIRVSKLLRNSDASASILPSEFVPGLEAMAVEILGDGAAVIEVMPLDQFLDHPSEG